MTTDPTAELLRAVASQIIEEPEHYRQGHWILLPDGRSLSFGQFFRTRDAHPEEVCGSACCVAGWSVTLANVDKDKALEYGDFDELAAKLLGFSGDLGEAVFDGMADVALASQIFQTAPQALSKRERAEGMARLLQALAEYPPTREAALLKELGIVTHDGMFGSCSIACWDPEDNEPEPLLPPYRKDAS